MSLEKEAREYLLKKEIISPPHKDLQIGFTDGSTEMLTHIMSDFATQQTEKLRDENKRLEEKLSEVDGKNYDLESKDMELQQIKEKLKRCEDTHAILEDLCVDIEFNNFEISEELKRRIKRFNMNDFNPTKR